MSDKSEWRPKVGERVAIYGTVVDEMPHLRDSYGVEREGQPRGMGWHGADELSPLPAPRHPWDVLREAADIMGGEGSVAFLLYAEAIDLEAAAAPRPPTLREAVRAWLDFDEGTLARAVAMNAIKEALAREESGV